MGRRRRTRPGTATDPAGPPELTGHDIVGPVGFGANGAVWAARDRAGHDVVVSVLPLPPGEAGTARLRRLAALRHGTHPHLARIRQVVSLGGGRCAVVSDRVPGPTLATVVAARGRLAGPELAALLTGVGSALGHLHERGVVHGDVSPANVVVTDDGVPVLVDLAGHGHDLGTPGFVPPECSRGRAAGAPGDVWTLARLVAWAAGSAPNVLRLLGEALDVDPANRPAARDVASRAPALGACRAISVPPAGVLAQARMRDDAAPTRRRPGTRPRGPGRAARPVTRPRVPPRPGPARASPAAARHVRGRPVPSVWLGTAASIGVAALLAGLLAWPAPGDRAGGADVRADTGQPGPAEAVVELLARRDGALVAGDATALAATTVPGGPAARADVALLERLESTGTTLRELRTEVARIDAVTPLDDGTAVDVVLVQGAHDRVVAGARATVPAQPAACARLVLREGVPGTWQIVDSGPCP
ncbi:protein kinase domain-containing protein [Georgenia sp. H159]|uniref:protein kinase domain-containing protein n=1 Tax=Georgenia sp. H159 TaxID=3076115 RepID=UPI002D7A1EA9|nr:protein kinase [Georgenia sp. H159]